MTQLNQNTIAQNPRAQNPRAQNPRAQNPRAQNTSQAKPVVTQRGIVSSFFSPLATFSALAMVAILSGCPVVDGPGECTSNDQCFTDTVRPYGCDTDSGTCLVSCDNTATDPDGSCLCSETCTAGICKAGTSTSPTCASDSTNTTTN